MLIITEKSVWHLGNGDTQTGPLCIFEGEGVRRASETNNLRVLLLDNNHLWVSRRSKPAKTFPTDIKDRVDSLIILDENPLTILIGTVGAHLYKWVDGEGSAKIVENFEGLDCRKKWYTPWGGPPTVRSLASTKNGWVYADIHVGSIMRSRDRGVSWEPVSPTLDEDVHQVATCPSESHNLYAATADSVFISENHGDSWSRRKDGMTAIYSRAIAVHPDDPSCLLATVSNGPHGEDVHGELFRTEDSGQSWEHVKDGFPVSTINNIDTYQVKFTSDGIAMASVGNTLYQGLNKGSQWSKRWEAPHNINAIY